MKRKRYDMEKKKTELQTAIEELSLFIITKPVDNTETTHIPLRPLLSFCNLIIQVLGIIFYFIGDYSSLIISFLKFPNESGLSLMFILSITRWVSWDVCVLVFADKIGPTMAVLRQDIDQNIQVTKDNVVNKKN